MEKIVRNLSDGPDYMPDWRHRVVQGYLDEIAKSNNTVGKLTEILEAEKDPFVRQYLRFRYNGQCVRQSSFEFASACMARNAVSGAASMIKAMILGDRTPEEIAVELGTERENVVTFCKVYFDVRSYLGNETFLRRIAFSDPPEGMPETEAARERRWLAAAFNRGWAGVEQVVLRRTPSSPEQLEQMSRQLQGALSSRALEFVQGLDTEATAPGDADLTRYLRVVAAHSHQPGREEQSDQKKMMQTFLHGITGMLDKKAEENPDDLGLAAVLELKRSKVSTPATVPTRMRKRFTNG